MEKKVKLLLAEDDENLGLLLKEYLIAKGYIKLIKDTMDVDITDEEEILDQIKKEKDKQKKDSGDNKIRIKTEAILPNEKKKPEEKDSIK